MARFGLAGVGVGGVTICSGQEGSWGSSCWYRSHRSPPPDRQNN